MNNSPPPTMSGWSFGSQSPVPLPHATPTLVPRPQIPIGAPAVLRPRNLFPGLPNSSFLSLGPRFFAVADPNAPPAGLPPVHDPMIVDVPLVAPTVEIPPAPVALVASVVPAPLAPALEEVVPASLALQLRDAQSHIQSLQAIILSNGGSHVSSTLVPSPFREHPDSHVHVDPTSSYPSLVPFKFRAVPGTSVAKLPLPDTISSLKQLVNDPAAITQKLKRIFAHLLRSGANWPMDVISFITESSAAQWTESYLEHAQKTESFDQDVFIAKFVAFVTGEVRPRSAIALEEIMDHLITQGTDSAAQYAECFMQRARILTHISPVILCHHFVNGLNPDLKMLCCVDREGQDWVALSPLIAFTIVEERRLSLVSRSRPVLSSDSTHFKSKKRWRSQGERLDWSPAPGFKKARLAAVHKEMDHAAGGPSGYANAVRSRSEASPSKPSCSDGRPGPSKAAGPPARLGPPESCIYFKLNNKGRPLHSWEQQCLTAYGLCWYCKESTEHTANHCPLKKAAAARKN